MQNPLWFILSYIICLVQLARCCCSPSSWSSYLEYLWCANSALCDVNTRQWYVHNSCCFVRCCIYISSRVSPHVKPPRVTGSNPPASPGWTPWIFLYYYVRNGSWTTVCPTYICNNSGCSMALCGGKCVPYKPETKLMCTTHACLF